MISRAGLPFRGLLRAIPGAGQTGIISPPCERTREKPALQQPATPLFAAGETGQAEAAPHNGRQLALASKLNRR